MNNEQTCFSPGNRVQFIKDEFDIGSVDHIVLFGTKGSVGIILSFDDYRAEHEQQLKRSGITGTKLAAREHWFTSVKRAIEECRKYPIRLETVLPSEHPVDLVYDEGSIVLISTSSLEKIE